MKVFSQELIGEDSCFPLPFGNVCSKLTEGLFETKKNKDV